MSRRRGGFDVEEAFGFAVCVLGLSPREAWTASLRELALAARILGGPDQAPRRADLERLMARFPDR